ncbi:paxillin [Leptopilina heterotoma]|uniref:paxillin n=1 Tax=Leptopilina heterotoma TaxID=63436 RepID=UPI001CA9D26F|nr:paxillin [Leptopilina heterotoma]
MEQEDNRPKWLQELENRKRKPRLAHEAGAGSPCLVCTSACPGLDLHFWRKICKNCKCDRDDHDVNDNEFPQFDLLFGPSAKSKNRSFFLRVKKQNQDETPFEWIPPNTSKELAADYMKALPDEKLPIKGSAGAAFRRQQLQKQLPLHDIDHEVCDQLSEQERTQFQEYLQNLKNYVGQGKVIKSLGARPFSKSLMTPANATDVQQFSPQHKVGILSSGVGVNLRTPSSFINKTPNTFQYSSTEPPPLPLSQPPNNSPLPLNLQSIGAEYRESSSESLPNRSQTSSILNKSLPSNVEFVRTQMLESSLENSPQGRYHRALINTPNDSKFVKSETIDDVNIPQKSKIFSPGAKRISEASSRVETTGGIDSFVVDSDHLPQDLAEKMLSEALLPPSAIHAADIIGSTLDEKGLMYIREKLNSMNSGKEDIEQQGPFRSRELEGLPKQEIEKLINTRHEVSNSRSEFLPQMSSHQGKSVSAYASDVLRESLANAHQSFSNEQKLQSAHSSHPVRNISSIADSSPANSPANAKLSNYGSIPTCVINSEELYNPIFPEEAVGGFSSLNSSSVDQLAEELENSGIIPTKQNCHKCHEEINVGDVVVTAEKAKNEVWHPGCFVCTVCNELLADLVYFFYKGQLYCGRDLATHLNIQRCFACDELIFTSMYTVAEGHTYHVKHFCCWDCDEPLAGKQYTSENDRPLCLPCYQKVYAKICGSCNQAIAADQQGVAIKNLDFHVDEKCFCCFTCKKSLLNGKIGIKENKPFCSKECITIFQNQKS